MQANLIPLAEIHRVTKEKYIAATRNFISHWRNREVLRLGYGREIGQEQTYSSSFNLTGNDWIERISWTGQVFLGIDPCDFKLGDMAIRLATRMTMFYLLSRKEYNNLAAHTLYLLDFIHPFEVVKSTGKVEPRVPWSLQYLPYEWTGAAVCHMSNFFGRDCLRKTFELVAYGDEIGNVELPQPICQDRIYPTHMVDGKNVRRADPFLLGLHNVHTYKLGCIVKMNWTTTRKLPRQRDYIVGLHMPNHCRLCDRIRVHVPLGQDSLRSREVQQVMDAHFQCIE